MNFTEARCRSDKKNMTSTRSSVVSIKNSDTMMIAGASAMPARVKAARSG
jgi:hypothetical protein